MEYERVGNLLRYKSGLWIFNKNSIFFFFSEDCLTSIKALGSKSPGWSNFFQLWAENWPLQMPEIRRNNVEQSLSFSSSWSDRLLATNYWRSLISVEAVWPRKNERMPRKEDTIAWQLISDQFCLNIITFLEFVSVWKLKWASIYLLNYSFTLCLLGHPILHSNRVTFFYEWRKSN